MAWKNFDEWVDQVPESIRRDPLWQFQVYPKALFLADLAWEDTERMVKDPRGQVIAVQLIRSVCSICANLEEGHGRGFGASLWGLRGKREGGITGGAASFRRKSSATASNFWTKSSPPLSSRQRENGSAVGPEPAVPSPLISLAKHVLHPASCILHPASCTFILGGEK